MNPVIKCINCGMNHVASHPDCSANPNNRSQDPKLTKLQQKRKALPGQNNIRNQRQRPVGFNPPPPSNQRGREGRSYAEVISPHSRESRRAAPPARETRTEQVDENRQEITELLRWLKESNIPEQLRELKASVEALKQNQTQSVGTL